MDCVSPFIEPISKYAIDPALRLINYLRKAKRNVDDMIEELTSLIAMSNDVRQQILEVERRGGRRRSSISEDWLLRVSGAETTAEQIKSKYFQRGCLVCETCSWSFWSIYNISKKAKNHRQLLQNLQAKRPPFDELFALVPPEAISEIPTSANVIGLASYLIKIQKYLEDDKVDIVGIWGMGGVGKSTVLDKINNDLYHNIHSNDPLDKVAANAHKRKVIITTRSEEVCGQMRAEPLKIECLNFEDAWSLFKDIVGVKILLMYPMIENLAKQVAKECRGLPLALKVIGGAMARKTNIEVWKHCLNLLRRSQASDIAEPMFNVLKFSYDQLNNDTLRKCFLSCSLWPENHNIDKEELITCWLGLGLMDDAADMEEVYGQGYYLLTILQQSCLLEPGENDSVKMHDMMRDLALWIANGCGKSNYEWIVRSGATSDNALKEIEKWGSAKRVSLMYSKIDELPHGLPSCPNLSALILGRNDIKRIPEGSFQCLTSLTYLDLTRNYKMENLPSSIGLLSQLKYLDLSYTSMKSLPKEMGALMKLEYLFLQGTEAAVGQELISRLQSLKILHAFPHTTIDLMSVECLSKKLIALAIKVDNIKTFRALIEKHVSITNFSIEDLENVGSFSLSQELKYVQRLELRCSSSLKEIVVIGDEAKEIEFPKLRGIILHSLTRLERIDWNGLEPASCFRILQEVRIYRCKLKNVSWVLELPKLVSLYLIECDEIERVIGEEEEKMFLERRGTSADIAAFPCLDRLYLWHLPLLESICDHPLPFRYLRLVQTKNCPKLKRLPFRPEIATNNKHFKIVAERSWWDGLVWKDENTKASFHDSFYETVHLAAIHPRTA